MKTNRMKTKKGEKEDQGRRKRKPEDTAREMQYFHMNAQTRTRTRKQTEDLGQVLRPRATAHSPRQERRKEAGKM